MEGVTKEMTHQNKLNQFNPIQKIIIENFQSHQNTQIIPAGPGQLTVIVGQSRQGKTAIFRALRWLFYNAPDGADFIRWGATFARVTAEYADGTQVIRYRTAGGVNRYIIRKPGEQEQVYEGFGRGAVPLEVQQVTGVSPVEIGEGLTLNLNLAEQLDGPFLGNKAVSSTSRAKVLGKLAGTEEVDLAGKQLGTDLFRWKREQEAHEKAIRETEEQLRGYDYLPGFKANLDNLARIRDAIKGAVDRREKLNTLYREYNQVNFRANEERLRMLRCRNLIEKMVPAVEAIEGQIWRAGEMNRLKVEWDKNSASILVAEATIRSTQGLSQAEELLKGAEGRFGRRQQAETIIARWNKTVWDLEQAYEVIGDTQGIRTAERLINAAQKDLAQIDRLFSIYYQFGVVKGGICKADSVLYETKEALSAEPMIAELYASVDRKDKLAVLMEKWQISKDVMAVVERQIQRTGGLGHAYLLSGKIQEDISLKRGLSNLYWENDSIKNNLGTANFWIKHFGGEIEKLQSEYYETLKQAGKCPTCGGNVDKDKLMEII